MSDGKPALSKSSCSVRRYQDVVFYADAAKIIVSLQFLIIHEVPAKAFTAELFDKRRNEIDAGFIGDDVPRNKAASHPQRTKSKLLRPRLVRIVAYIVFSEVLHIVDIQAHIMAKAVRLEEARDSGGDHLVQVSLH